MSSGVIDGQSVNAAVTNAAFLAANGPSTGVGVLTLAEAASSGPAVNNVQNTINVLINTVGGDQSTPATSYPTVPANTITSGDTHQQALIDLANLFDETTGHAHDGTAGGGAPINFDNLTGTQLVGYGVLGTPITSASGINTNVTSLLTGSQNSYGQTIAGVVTNAPYNYIQIFDANGDSYVSASGNKVYGRLTAAPSASLSPSAWTLSYYENLSGTETTYSMPASSYVNWYYQQLYTEATRPVYSDSFVVTSDQVAGIVPDATTAVKGKVMLSSAAQSVGSANAAGTANATVANADHVHQGVHSLAASGSSQLYGDVTVSASGAAQVAQSGQNITVYAPASGAAVNSFAASGQAALTGAVTISAGSNVTLTQAGQNIEIAAAASGAAVNSLAASGFAPLTGSITIAPSGGVSLGQSGQVITVYAPTGGGGVTSFAASGQSALTGAVTISASGATQLTQSGQNISIYAPASGAAVNSLAASGQSALTGAVTLSASGGITLTQSGQNIQIYAATGGGGGSGSFISASLTTRVTAAPSATGQYRTLIKDNAAATFSDTDGSSRFSSSNGMQIYGSGGTGAGTSTQPNRWSIYVGTNKTVIPFFYNTTGKTGRISCGYYWNPNNAESGLDFSYDPTTGIATMTIPVLDSSAGNRYVGRYYSSDTASFTQVNNCYFDLLVI